MNEADPVVKVTFSYQGTGDTDEASAPPGNAAGPCYSRRTTTKTPLRISR